MAGKVTLTNAEIDVLVTALVAGTAWADAKLLLADHDDAFLDTQEAAVTAIATQRADEAELAPEAMVAYLKTLCPPTITAVTPDITTAKADTVSRTPVRIDGDGFFADTAITFDAVPAEAVEFVNHKTIKCLAPAHAAAAIDVVATNANTLADTAAGALTHAVVAPNYTSLAPAHGPIAGGTQVLIKGSDFFEDTTVDFDATPATDVVVLSPTLLSCKAPAHIAGAVAVTIKNANTSTVVAAASFTYA